MSCLFSSLTNITLVKRYINISCPQVIVTLDVTLCTASIYNMIGISADRFLAVFRPASYMTTEYTFTNTVIASSWLLGLAVSLPMHVQWPGFREGLKKIKKSVEYSTLGLTPW